MFAVLQLVTIMLIALAAALSVAHALEFPGKLRLDEHTYRAVQPIYYPGFTVAGALAEPGGIIATALLLWFSPRNTAGFRFVLVAFAGMIVMHAIYWIVTHPVNNFWLDRHRATDAASRAFFGFGSKREGWNPDWAELRDRWKYSHVARAVITSIGLLMLLLSLALGS